MTKVEIYTKNWCPYSVRAREFLQARRVNFEEIDVTTDTAREAEMVQRAGRTSVPQIFIDNHHLGGSDDLIAADRNGTLSRLLNEPVAA
jgi:glutaredoxin 3